MQAINSQPRIGPLEGLSILVVEDDYFVAYELARELRAQGASMVGPVPDLARARAAIADQSPDCVLLDINLKGDYVFDLAEEVMACGIPTIFTTAYDASVIPSDLRGAPCLQKPIVTQELVRLVQLEATSRA